MMKKIFIILLTVFLSFNLLTDISFAQTEETQLPEEFDFNEQDFSFDNFSDYQEPIERYYEKAKILEIKEKQSSEEDFYFGDNLTIQEIKLKILGGKFKGKEEIVENNMLYNPLRLEIEQGDNVLVFIEEYEGDVIAVYIQDHWRLPFLLGLVGFFLLALFAVGGIKGLKAILSLVFSIVVIFQFLIPRILNGGNPIFLALMISIIVTIVTLLLVGGLQKKTYSAMIGTVGGVAVAMLLAILAGKVSNLTGLASEESRLLYSNFPDLNLKGLLFAGIMIGALGAVMDVGMSIASSIAEIKKVHPRADFKKLVSAGFNVGRDIMGTMTNTLIFAYVGVSLPLLLLFTKLGESYLKFLNFEFIAEEIVRSMAGSIGLLAALPITALVSAYFENKKGNE